MASLCKYGRDVHRVQIVALADAILPVYCFPLSPKFTVIKDFGKNPILILVDVR